MTNLPATTTPPTPSPNDSPPWNRTTKAIVAIITLLLFWAIAQRFQLLITQLVAAAILAYVLNPIIIIIDKRTTLKRSHGILIVYLVVLIAFFASVIALGVAAVEQVTNLINEVPTLIEETTATFRAWTLRTDAIAIGPFALTPNNIDWNAITDQLLSLVQPVVSQGGQFVRSLASTTVRGLGNLLFVYIISIYVAIEIPRLGGYVGDIAQPPGYRRDAERLTGEFGRIWSAYLRGQVILGLIIFFIVWIGLSLLGVRNSLALGLLSGLLEFVPVLGPVIGAGAAIVVAFFQQGNYLGLESWQLATAVLIFMFAVQQIENSVLVPRIVGQALDLHPLVVMVGVFMGGSLAGILGAILAAPVVATLKLVGIYGWRKFFDLPPFPTDEPEIEPPPTPSLLERGRELIGQLSTRKKS